jgi:DNA polymerase
MSHPNDIIQDYLQIVATVREHVEEQMQLGFTELFEEPEEKSEFADFDMRRLRDEAMGCERCELHKTRRTVVFGVGNENADLMFVGEAPGADEDRQGEPFVGQAGQLLTKIIEAMKLTRDQVYIANVIKCRPPGNRTPQPIEIESCEPFLRRQVELIKPKVICALGAVAAQALLRTDQKISMLRGRFHDYHGIKVMPTYHPAYLLRNPHGKREVWEDMKKVMAELRIDP